MASIPESLSLARQAIDAGDLARAGQIYQQVLVSAPEDPQALSGLSEVAVAGGRLDEAADYVLRAIARAPREPAFHNSLYEIRRAQGRLEEAAMACQKALELMPGSPELHSNLGVVRRQQGQFELAVASFQRALELAPHLAIVHYNLGNAYGALEELEAAEASFRRALELVPGHADVHLNLASNLQLQARNAELLEHFDAALAAQPDLAFAHLGKASVLLRQGNFAEGWPEYEWRLKAFTPISETDMLWQGQPLTGRTLLLVGEQGLGDVLQFIRYAPLAKAQAARVIVGCTAALHPILARTPGVDAWVTPRTEGVEADFCVPLLSMPLRMHTTLETIPAQVPYIFADPQRVETWQQRLKVYDGLKVGIVWQGATAERSIRLAEFAPLGGLSGVRLVNLQKGAGYEQLAEFAGTWPVIDFAEELDAAGGAFMDTAAIMKNLDVVITCDTAAGHLAGALGVKVWLALQTVAECRWLADRDDSPWYPTMRLFRQSRRSHWQDVFTRMAAELESLAARGRPRESDWRVDFD